MLLGFYLDASLMLSCLSGIYQVCVTWEFVNAGEVRIYIMCITPIEANGNICLSKLNVSSGNDA